MAEIPNFPDKSQKSRLVGPTEPPQTKSIPKLDKIVSGTVTVKKSPLYKRAISAIIVEDVRTVGPGVVRDVLIPALRDLAFDMVNGFASRTFGIQIQRPSTQSMIRHTSASGVFNRAVSQPVNYSFTNSNRPTMNTPDGKGGYTSTATKNETFVLDDFVFEDRGQAQAALEGLENLIEEYQQAPVSSLYDMLGLTSDHVQQRWGWRSTVGAEVIRSSSGGYILRLPKAQPLD